MLCAPTQPTMCGLGINYLAVCALFQVPASAVALGLAVDNVMAILYFPLCSLLGRGCSDPASASAGALGGVGGSSTRGRGPASGPVVVDTMVKAIAAALGIVAVSEWLFGRWGLAARGQARAHSTWPGKTLVDGEEAQRAEGSPSSLAPRVVICAPAPADHEPGGA